MEMGREEEGIASMKKRCGGKIVVKIMRDGIVFLFLSFLEICRNHNHLETVE
jgi:hypothetical protein